MTATLSPAMPANLRDASNEASSSARTFDEPVADGHWPDWFVAAQQCAWAGYEQTPHPKRTDEAWRFSQIGALDLAGFHRPGLVSDPETLKGASRGYDKISARFVFGNDTLLSAEVPALPAGIIALPLERAVREHEDLFRSYFLQRPVELGSHKYAQLHQAQLRSGLLLYVPPETKVPDPIEVHHWVEGENAAVFPHTLIILGEGAEATVIDFFRSADGRRALGCGINDLHVGDRARLHYLAQQSWSESSLAFHLNSTVVGRDAISTALSLNFGGGFVRGESASDMTAPGARSEMLSINPLDGNRMVDQRTLQLHSAPGATSDLLYHNTLDEKSRSIFAGLIKVAEGAHQTDAYQKVRNLLLSDDAEANSMPGLEILADEVKCSHGATSGELNAEELFYLEARGIPREVGRRMVVMGFFDSLLERIEDDGLRHYLSEEVRNHLRLS